MCVGVYKMCFACLKSRQVVVVVGWLVGWLLLIVGYGLVSFAVVMMVMVWWSKVEWSEDERKLKMWKHKNLCWLVGYRG